MTNLIFREQDLEIPGEWTLPDCYNPQADLLIELTSTRQYSRQKLSGIQRRLTNKNLWSCFSQKSLFIMVPSPNARVALCELGFQIQSYARRRGIKDLVYLEGPLWRGSDGKVYSPDYVVDHRGAIPDYEDDTKDVVCNHTGLLAIQFGDELCEDGWNHMVISGAFTCVVGLIPGSLKVVLCTPEGKSVLMDPDYVDLGAALKYLRVYLGGNSFLWPTTKELDYRFKSDRDLADLLMGCIYSGNTEEAKAVIQFMSSFNYLDKLGVLPLETAASLDRLEIVEYMCAYGGDLDVPDRFGCTARTAAKGATQRFINTNYPRVAGSRPSHIRIGPLSKEYGWEVLDKFEGVPCKICSKITTEEGTFVELWLNDDDDGKLEQAVRSFVNSDSISVY